LGRVLSALITVTILWTGINAWADDKLPVAAAIASADDGNVPANALDGSIATRWSASGDGQWIRFDLGASKSIGSIRLAWHKGDLRRAQFDVQTSSDASTWTTVFTGQSSGTTTNLETYDVTDASARYVRVVGHGTSTDAWNSLSEAEIYVPGAAVPISGLHLKIARGSGNRPQITLMNGQAGTTYQLQVSSNGMNWAAAGYTFTNNGLAQTWQDPATTTWRSRFYRVKQGTVTAPPTNVPLPTITKTLAGLQIGSKKVVHYRNRPLNVYDPRVTRAIIMVHGSGANASGYFDRINNVIPSNFDEKVLIIAPHFQEEAEAASDEYWWDGDWREGGASGGISSYAVVDKFVELLRNGTFPNLKWVVVGGHSAGGQFSQRYAAFTDIDLKTTPNSQFVKFVPANPSSYVYLNQYRPDGNGNWIIPPSCTSGDEDYNEWKYGLEGLYGYTATRGAEFARTHLPRRWVELLAGTFDNVVDDGLDVDCGAMRQGERRYDRAQNFNAFMDRYYPGNNFSMTLVPEVGHDSELIFASPAGVKAYFFAD
jgi:pimeloyl-ACP methyl ester carboxylesterase